jgi:hypothetical protein
MDCSGSRPRSLTPAAIDPRALNVQQAFRPLAETIVFE